MLTVALIGPDGVGKSTVARQLESSFPRRIKYIYMGDNVRSSNVTLPTTRWWKTRRLHEEERAAATGAAGNAAAGRPATLPRTVRRATRKTLGFCNRILEETYRQLVATSYAWRGYIVLFDRHFLWDYYHFDIEPGSARRPFKRRLHGFLLRHMQRRPDLVVCLDAPGEVVYQRKGEFSPQHLDARRGQYLQLGDVIPNFAVVDADRPLEIVVQDVGRVIDEFRRNGRHGRR